ncbi:MAG: hypothetical protein ABWW66_04655 [Archaeoglobaceae archaeon]
MSWKLKDEKLASYLEAKERGEIDHDIVEVLDFINSLPNYVTLSSCSGRIAVVDTPKVGDKAAARFAGKWHREVSVEEVEEAAKTCESVGWLIQYPPIIHVACRSIEDARFLLEIANNAGFRRSGVISLKNLIVEISSLERMELPVSVEGELLVDRDYLELVVKFANEKLRRGKEKVKRLYLLLKE